MIIILLQRITKTNKCKKTTVAFKFARFKDSQL